MPVQVVERECCEHRRDTSVKTPEEALAPASETFGEGLAVSHRDLDSVSSGTATELRRISLYFSYAKRADLGAYRAEAFHLGKSRRKLHQPDLGCKRQCVALYP